MEKAEKWRIFMTNFTKFNLLSGAHRIMLQFLFPFILNQQCLYIYIIASSRIYGTHCFSNMCNMYVKIFEIIFRLLCSENER